MEVCGVTGRLADRVNLLGLSFQIKGLLSNKRLREILIDCTEYFIAAVNANEKIRPYLKNYPFTANEIELELFLTAADGKDLYAPDISVVSTFSGKVWYSTYEKDRLYGGRSTIEESYEDALKIVRESKK